MKTRIPQYEAADFGYSIKLDSLHNLMKVWSFAAKIWRYISFLLLHALEVDNSETKFIAVRARC